MSMFLIYSGAHPHQGLYNQIEAGRTKPLRFSTPIGKLLYPGRAFSPKMFAIDITF